MALTISRESSVAEVEKDIGNKMLMGESNVFVCVATRLSLAIFLSSYSWELLVNLPISLERSVLFALAF